MSDERILIIEHCEECPWFIDSHKMCEKGCVIQEDAEDGIYHIPDECDLKKRDDYILIKHDELKELFNRKTGG